MNDKTDKPTVERERDGDWPDDPLSCLLASIDEKLNATRPDEWPVNMNVHANMPQDMYRAILDGKHANPNTKHAELLERRTLEDLLDQAGATMPMRVLARRVYVLAGYDHATKTVKGWTK